MTLSALHRNDLNLLCLLLLVLAQGPQREPNASDWPGLWGPARNGRAAAALPRGIQGIREAWRRATAGGYSEIAVAGDLAVTLELRGNDDFVLALDAASGRERWSTRIGATYRGHDGSDDGPIATPAIVDREVYAIGPHGDLLALDAATGRVRWRHDLVREFQASVPQWGFGSSPLIEGSLVIVPAGGAAGHGLLAFDRRTGALAWSAPHMKSTTYSSAVGATLAGMRQVVVATQDRIFAVAPADGRLLWATAGAGGGIEVSNSPIVLPGDRVLVSLWPEARMFTITRQGTAMAAAETWRSPRLRSYNGPSVFRDGYLYGFAGDVLVCVEAGSGALVWRERVGDGTLVLAGEHLVILGETSGELRVVAAQSSGYAELFKTRVLGAEIRAVTGASIAGGRLFVRNLKEIAAFTFVE